MCDSVRHVHIIISCIYVGSPLCYVSLPLLSLHLSMPSTFLQGASKTGKAPDGSSYIDCAESDEVKALLKWSLTFNHYLYSFVYYETVCIFFSLTHMYISLIVRHTKIPPHQLKFIFFFAANKMKNLYYSFNICSKLNISSCHVCWCLEITIIIFFCH